MCDLLEYNGQIMKELKKPFAAGITILILLSLFSFTNSSAVKLEGVLRVVFLDVGQGDATFIESPTGVQTLIDGGADSRVLSALSSQMGFFDHDIDMIVATHPDQDHIGGLIDVLIRHNVKNVLMTENVNDTPVYESFMEAVKEEGANILYARAGQVYDLGMGSAGSTTLTILFPDHDPMNLESNMSSIVAQLRYGNSTYLLTGDSPKEIEEYLVARDGSRLTSNVLKVGHHGSRTSTSEIFLSTIAPSHAVISAGKDNSYGHPHKEVIDLLTQYSVIQNNTADEGNIISESDGASILFR